MFPPRVQIVLELCDREGYIIKLTRECRELLEQIIDADEALTVAMVMLRNKRPVLGNRRS